MRLDSRSKFPSGMEDYLEANGWHFNKKMCEFAINSMRKQNNTKIVPYNKESVDLLLQKNNISINNNNGYDYIFVANMCKADYFGSSIIDETRLIIFIKDYIDDADGYEGLPFTRFYADCIGKGIVIPWEDLI